MSASSRVGTVARTQGTDLLRRRLALAMLLLLPAVIYLTVFAEESEILPDADPWTLQVGVVGVAWAVAGGAFFLGLSSRRVDERLLLAGYRRIDLAGGRILFLVALALPIVVVYGTLITALSDADAAPILLAVASTGVVAVALGLALAAIVPRELEGVLALIGVVGVQASIPADIAFAPALPFHGPIELVGIAWRSSGSVVPPLLHSAAATAVLLGVFLALWGRRLGVRPPRRPADGQ